jgi:hypothetical protein
MSEITSEHLPICENCKAPHGTDQKFCQQCSFPVGGTDTEKQAFRMNVGMHQQWLRNATKETGTAKTIIYILAGIFLLFGIYQGLAVDDFAGLITNLIVCVVFLVLAAWTDSNPFGAILTAFIIYLTIQLFNFFLDPATLFGGILWKVLIISGFLKGIRSAQEAQRLRKKLEQLKAAG